MVAGAFARTIQQRSVNAYEMTLMPEGGKHAIHVGATLSCVIDDSGAIKGVTAWMRDISNRKELEEHLTRTRHMASVGTLAAGVAHHFNNIACGMGTMVEFALATEEPIAMLKALKMSKGGRVYAHPLHHAEPACVFGRCDCSGGRRGVCGAERFRN